MIRCKLSEISGGASVCRMMPSQQGQPAQWPRGVHQQGQENLQLIPHPRALPHLTAAVVAARCANPVPQAVAHRAHGDLLPRHITSRKRQGCRQSAEHALVHLPRPSV